MHPLLSSLQRIESETTKEILAEVQGLSQQLVSENIRLQEEVARLSQIVQDVRERDANKKCLCRGFGG